MSWPGTGTTYESPPPPKLGRRPQLTLQVPYKYDLTKFVNVGSISVDHIDPSIFCVLTAKSRDLTAPLADLLIFSPRWDVASRRSLYFSEKHKPFF